MNKSQAILKLFEMDWTDWDDVRKWAEKSNNIYLGEVVNEKPDAEGKLLIKYKGKKFGVMPVENSRTKFKKGDGVSFVMDKGKEATDLRLHGETHDGLYYHDLSVPADAPADGDDGRYMEPELEIDVDDIVQWYADQDGGEAGGWSYAKGDWV